MDTLGFKERIKRSRGKPVLQQELFRALQRLRREENRNFAVSTFSDHLAASMPADSENLSDLFDAAVDVSLALITSVGLLVRGAVTVGDLIHDGKVIFGPALIDAWEMEQKKSNNPRIILDKEVPLPKGYEDAFLTDDDGYRFIDFFSPRWKKYISMNQPGREAYRLEQLVLIRNSVEKNLARAEDERDFNKSVWFAKRFNEAMERNRYEVGRVSEDRMRRVHRQ